MRVSLGQILAARGPLGSVNPLSHIRTVGNGLPSNVAKSAVVSLPVSLHFFKRADNPSKALAADGVVEGVVKIGIQGCSCCYAEVLWSRCRVWGLRLMIRRLRLRCGRLLMLLGLATEPLLLGCVGDRLRLGLYLWTRCALLARRSSAGWQLVRRGCSRSGRGRVRICRMATETRGGCGLAALRR